MTFQHQSSNQLNSMINALILACNDKNDSVKEVVMSSLGTLGTKKPFQSLDTIKKFLINHPKLDQNHRVILLKVMHNILKSTLDQIQSDSSFAIDIIVFASNEMTKNKKVIPEWQSCASDILVTMGTVFVDEVMQEMLQKFIPGAIPHFFVVQTFGNLAVANVFKMVPHLKLILSTTLPMLGLIKHDNMRWIFAVTLLKFAEAILEYTTSGDERMDKDITVATFYNEIFGAFDILYVVWFQSKEVKLRNAVVESLGKMFRLLEVSRMNEYANKLLTSIISLFKRQPNDLYPVSKALYDIIIACNENESVNIPDQILDNLVTSLHTQICVLGSADTITSTNLKIYNEILRCVGGLVPHHFELLINFSLARVDARDENSRSGSLQMLRYVINTSPTLVSNQKELLVIGLYKTLGEANANVAQNITRVISAMASHGFLKQEGGNRFIDFLVKQSSLDDDALQKGKSASSHALQAMSDNVLYLITTTVENMDQVLWPYMLGHIVSQINTMSVGIVCRCLAHIAQIKRSEQHDDYIIDFQQQVNLPSPFAIIARLFVLLSQPRHQRFNALHILDLLQHIGPVLHDNIAQLWDDLIPKIRDKLQDKEVEFCQQNWEQEIFKFISSTIDAINDNEWTCALCSEIQSQWTLYDAMPIFKNFSYKCFGIVMRLISNKEFVEKSINALLQSVKHTEVLEREGAGIGFGYAASTHLDLCLSNLDKFCIKSNIHKKESSLFGFFKSDKGLSENERIKGTAALCFGQAAFYADSNLIKSRVEGSIIKNITNFFKGTKDPVVKCNILYACELIAASLHPSHSAHPLNDQSTNQSNDRNESKSSYGEITNHILQFIRDDGLAHASQIKHLALNALTKFAKLSLFKNADKFEIVKTATEYCVTLPLFYETPAYEEKNDWQTKCMQSLHDLFEEIIKKSPTHVGLESLFKHIRTWPDKIHERERIFIIGEKLLAVYYKECIDFQSHESLSNMGEMMSCMIARCCDPIPRLRLHTLKSIRLLLLIQGKYNNIIYPEHEKSLIELDELKLMLTSEDPQVMYNTVKQIIKLILQCMPNDLTLYQNGSLTKCLISELLDAQTTCSKSACLALNHIFKIRGSQFTKEVNQIMESIVASLETITDTHTRSGTLRLVSLLTMHHLHGTINTLLAYSLPYNEHVTSCWKQLGCDKNCFEMVLEIVLNMLSLGLPYEHKSKKKAEKIATVNMLAVSCAIYEILDQSDVAILPMPSGTNAQSGFARAFAVLLMRISTMRDVSPPPKLNIDPLKQAIDTLSVLLSRVSSKEMIKILENESVWNHLASKDDEEFFKAVSVLGKLLSHHDVDGVASIVSCLNTFTSSVYEEQRITAVAFFAQVICESSNLVLLELVIDCVRSHLVDPSNTVRRLCIRGLSNIVKSPTELVTRYSTSVVSALMAGMDDKNDDNDAIIIEAMTGMEMFLNEMENLNMHSIFVNICLRIRPCFERDNAKVRELAVRLFGSMHRFAVDESKSDFKEQMHSNVIPLLLHLNDEDVNVRNACVTTLQTTSQMLGSDNVSSMLDRVLRLDRNLHYGEFMIDISKILVVDMPDKINFYLMNCVSFFKSQSARIRSNAVMLAGFFMENLPESNRAGISAEHICQAIVQLLKDNSSNVRAKAAEALSSFHHF